MTLAVNPLRRSHDRKVSPLSKWSGAMYRPQVANTFGLPAIVSCPGATATCKSACYAVRTERTYTSAQRLVQGNLDALKVARTTPAMAALLSAMIDEYRFESVRVSQKTGTPLRLAFRIHWDGDFFSVAYARAWRRVIEANTDIQFWAYTRSFTKTCNVVPTLAGIPNLALYVSADVDNQKLAHQVASAHNLRVAVMEKTYEAALDIAGTAPAVKCPENAKRVPLVADDGVGACIKCGLCVDGRKNVLFATTNR